MKHFLALLCAFAVLCGSSRAGEAVPKQKLPISGLVDMGDITFHRQDGGVAKNSLEQARRFPGILAGVVINITWEQLEPQRGELDTAEIDRFLEEIRAYNKENPKRPLGARLRVWPGPNAPKWAKHLGGSPVGILHKDMPITVGRYWDKPYREAWRDLQKRLAAKYDAEPLIREVTNASGSTITVEPFIVAGDPLSLKNLLAAGFNDRQFQETLRESCDDYAGWTTTGVEWAFNPYRAMDSGRPVVQPEFTLKMMQLWREKLGQRGILSNYSLNNPLAEQLVFIYDEIRRLGPPSCVETHSPKGLDTEGAIRNALDCRVGSVELWTRALEGFSAEDAKTLSRWAELLEKQSAH